MAIFPESSRTLFFAAVVDDVDAAAERSARPAAPSASDTTCRTDAWSTATTTRACSSHCTSRRPALIGVGEEPGEPYVAPMFTVADVTAACDAVRAAGGTAGEPRTEAYGSSAECRDDQGIRFWVARF